MPVPTPLARLTAAFAALAAIACAAESPRQAAVGDASAGAAAATADSAGARDSAAGDVAAADAAAPNASPGDTLKRGQAGVLAPGRNRHDAESFSAAIRKGESRLATWPKGPAPLPGALLPGGASSPTTATRTRRRWA
jgi:hypothetical protein